MATREALEQRCQALGLPMVAPLDPVNDALSALLGQQAKNKPGRQHVLDAACGPGLYAEELLRRRRASSGSTTPPTDATAGTGTPTNGKITTDTSTTS